MPLIAITVATEKGIDAMIVLCTQEEYEAYNMKDEINENTVSATFLQAYLKGRGMSIESVLEKAVSAPAGMSGYWAFAKVVAIPNLKFLLNEAGIDFHEFIDAYCNHLKSL